MRTCCCSPCAARISAVAWAAPSCAGSKTSRAPRARLVFASSACAKTQSRRNFYCEHGYHELDIAKKIYRGLKDGVHLEKWLRESA